VFLALLVWQDIAGLGHLVLQTASGGVAAVILFVMNGINFEGVQFFIAVVWAADDAAPPHSVLCMSCARLQPKLPPKRRARNRTINLRKRWRARSGRDGVNFPRA
jgi:hypothetical protein